MTAEETQLKAWVETLLGGPLTAWSRLVAGNSRTTWSGDAAGTAIVVRVDEGDGPFSDTPLTLEREVSVYRALQDRGIAIPRLYGFDSGAGAVVVERAPGEPAWSGEVIDALLRELARLHALEPAELELPGFAPRAFADLELWQGILERRATVGSTFAAFAFEFLRERFPGEPDRLVLDHGDPGVGNLLWHEGRISALLDWELSHLGDPHDDLAFLSVRAALFGVELDGFGRRVREHYGAADEQRLRYWQAVGILRNLVTCLASVSNPVRGRDRLVHHMLIPGLNRSLIDALARVDGITLPAPSLTAAPSAAPGAEVLSEIARDLGELAGEATDPERRQRLKRMRLLLGQLAETFPLAAGIARAEATGGPPARDPVDRLHQLAEHADRRLSLFPRALALATATPAGLN
jgi:aminoglycoside phosphotransferase (APT) family kinase protein